jgi:acyl-CoA thioester hydrolase
VPRTTEYPIVIRSTDMDADQIVNNARYFEFFEQARLEHLAALEVVKRPRPPGEPARSFTLAETTCRYRAPLRHRDRVTVRAWTHEVRNRSFILAYEIRLDDGDTLVAEGTSAQVWLDEEGRPSPLPDRVRAALEESMA